ncbi:MAG TPA: amidohydrolase family protein [Dehalococcoidia bacterium]|nr:amidohydrolase family protein [Dehalococcoidia bacterium]
MAKADCVIRGGLVVSGRGIIRADVLVGDGVIQEVGQNLQAPKAIDASGKYVLPGIIDAHNHPVYADKMDTFSLSAAYGGVTTIMPFFGNLAAWGTPGKTSEIIAKMIEEGERISYLDFAIHAAFVAEDDVRTEIPKLIKMGVPSFKMYMTYPKRGMMMPDDKMLEAMAMAAAEGGMAMVHAENGYAIDYLVEKFTAAGRVSREYFLPSQPNILEVDAVQRAATYAILTDCPLYCVHLSVREAPEIMARMKREGWRIYGETCPQYLSLTNQAVLERGALGKVGPPLREKEDNEAIWRGLASHAIDTVGSDSCNVKAEQKEWGGASTDFISGPGAKPRPGNIFEARFGMPSVETMLPVVYHDGVNGGRITLSRLVQTMCENPAKIFGLYPKKGVIQKDSDADLVIFDPNMPFTISAEGMHSNADFTIFEGKGVIGAPVFSMQRGEVIIEDGQCQRKQGNAQFLPGNRDLATYAKSGFPVE